MSPPLPEHRGFLHLSIVSMSNCDGAVAPLVVVMGVTALITACLFYRLLNNGRRRRSEVALPPGSLGLPFLGETLQFLSRSPSLGLLPFFQQRLERYGPVFKTNLLCKNLIVSLDPELNNYAFQQDEKAFQLGYPESFIRILGGDDNILTTSTASLHKNVRSMILRVFGPENLRQFLLHDVQRAVHRSLGSWLERPSIELKTELSRMIFSVTAKWLISYEASTSSGELWKQYDAFTRGLFAFPLNIPGTAFYSSMQGRKNVMKTLKQLLEVRKKSESRETNDFFDVVIDELKKERPMFTEEAVLNLLFLLLFASFETTSSGLTAVLRFLTDNTKAHQELVEEHEQIRKAKVDPDSDITWEEYKSMKFTSHVIHESLRLANIAPVLFRKAKQDVNIKGFTIPEGWTLMMCLSAVHLNPSTYEDPNTFNPWRWKDISEPVGGSKDFIAFGKGMRFCVGADFAKLQMAIFLHYLVSKYRWNVVGGGNMVLSPGLGFPEGFHIQLVRRP